MKLSRSWVLSLVDEFEADHGPGVGQPRVESNPHPSLVKLVETPAKPSQRSVYVRPVGRRDGIEQNIIRRRRSAKLADQPVDGPPCFPAGQPVSRAGADDVAVCQVVVRGS